MITKEQWRAREEQWKKFHEWEDAQPLPERSTEEIFQYLNAILSLAPPQAVTEDPDPEKRGIQKLRSMLERLSARR